MVEHCLFISRGLDLGNHLSLSFIVNEILFRLLTLFYRYDWVNFSTRYTRTCQVYQSSSTVFEKVLTIFCKIHIYSPIQKSWEMKSDQVSQSNLKEDAAQLCEEEQFTFIKPKNLNCDCIHKNQKFKPDKKMKNMLLAERELNQKQKVHWTVSCINSVKKTKVLPTKIRRI